MPNLSVKLDEATRRRLQTAADKQGITAHALMVRAIGNELQRDEAEEEFVARALAARERVVANGKAIDGQAYSRYLRARVRGEAVTCPSPEDICASTDPQA